MSKSFQIKRKAGYQRQGSDLRMASLTPSRSKIVDGTQVHSDDAIEKKFWSKFLMDKVLGKGGYGVVILIRDKTQGRPVALKLIEKNKTSEEVYSKLKHEPKILSKFAKSNYIVQMLDSFESQKRMFILMEYMEGGDLSQYIKKRQSEGYQFRETEIAVIITGLFKALKSIHGKKVIHGDIKPANLLLKEEGRYDLLKVADFGFSTITDSQQAAAGGVQAATTSYMAPEQASDSCRSTYATDVWSVGIIMAILLNQGTHPFYQQYETESEVKRKIVKGELGLHKIDCSDSAMNLLTRLLSRNPSDRPSATTALLHPWLSTTAVLSQNGAGSAVLMDLTKNEQKISSVLKNLAMLAYVRRFNRALIVRPEMRLSISIDESKLPKFIRKNSHTDNENTFNEGRLMNLELYLPQKSTRSRLNLLPRERASYEDHKKLNISNFPRASNIKLLSNYNRLSSPRKLDASNKPIFLRDSIKSRIIKTMGKGYTESRSPDLSNFKKKLSSVQLENPPFFPSKEMTHIMQGLNRSSAIPTKTSKA